MGQPMGYQALSHGKNQPALPPHSMTNTLTHSSPCLSHSHTLAAQTPPSPPSNQAHKADATDQKDALVTEVVKGRG